MIEKYTISFSFEADLKDKEELAAMVWTLLKIGKQALGSFSSLRPSRTLCWVPNKQQLS